MIRIITLIFLTAIWLSAFDTAWTQEIGGYENDSITSLSADEQGNIYAIGYSDGDILEYKNQGNYDVIITKLNSDGNISWLVGEGGDRGDIGRAIDYYKGYLYVCATTTSSKFENTNLSNGASFIQKFDTNGNKIWTQILTGSDTVNILDIKVKNDYIYVTGYQYLMIDDKQKHQPFIAKYNLNGDKIWFKTFNSDKILDMAKKLTIDDDENIYITGGTYGTFEGNTNFGEDDIFVAKFDKNGDNIWIKQFGGNKYEEGESITTDGEYIYIAGHTGSNLDSSVQDVGPNYAYIIKVDKNGNIIWTKMIGKRRYNDWFYDIDAGNNAVYAVGYTGNSLDENSNNGTYDILVVKYDLNGNKIWTKLYGTYFSDKGHGIKVQNNEIFIAGSTSGNLNGERGVGRADAFIVKMVDDSNDLFTYNLKKGWNLTSNTHTKDISGKDFLNKADGSIIWIYDNNSGKWTYITSWSEDAIIKKDTGFWIKIDKDTTIKY